MHFFILILMFFILIISVIFYTSKDNKSDDRSKTFQPENFNNGFMKKKTFHLDENRNSSSEIIRPFQHENFNNGSNQNKTFYLDDNGNSSFEVIRPFQTGNINYGSNQNKTFYLDDNGNSSFEVIQPCQPGNINYGSNQNKTFYLDDNGNSSFEVIQPCQPGNFNYGFFEIIQTFKPEFFINSSSGKFDSFDYRNFIDFVDDFLQNTNLNIILIFKNYTKMFVLACNLKKQILHLQQMTYFSKINNYEYDGNTYDTFNTFEYEYVDNENFERFKNYCIKLFNEILGLPSKIFIPDFLPISDQIEILISRINIISFKYKKVFRRLSDKNQIFSIFNTNENKKEFKSINMGENSSELTNLTPNFICKTLKSIFVYFYNGMQILFNTLLR